MTDCDDVTRTKVPVDPSDDDCDEKIRVYYSHRPDTPPMPSVSVVKGVREDDDKEEALSGWRDHYDGSDEWSRPWYRDQKAFKGYRGTLIHFAILAELGDASGDTYFHEVGDTGWGWEEYKAEYHLKKWSKKAPSANTDDIAFSPRDNEYDGEHAWDRAVRDMKWATRAFKEHVIDDVDTACRVNSNGDSAERVAEDGRLDPENVVAVEDFVYHCLSDGVGYGGQYDLLYETSDGRTVLADLKTSSGIRFDHRLQCAAYKYAVEATRDISVDECEVIRLYPDREEVEISRSNGNDSYFDGHVKASVARRLRGEDQLLAYEGSEPLDDVDGDEYVSVRHSVEPWTRSLNGLEHQFLGLAYRACERDYSDALAHAERELTEHAQSRQTELDGEEVVA